MDLNRFIVVGVDPKKSDYATCSFSNVAEASQSVYLYKKLGVTPVLIDLARIYPFCTVAKPVSGLPQVVVAATADNPTVYRLPRWVVFNQDAASAVTYDFATSVDAAASKAWAASRRGGISVVVSMNNGLMTHCCSPTVSSMPLRVDRDVCAATIDEMGFIGIWGKQYVVVSMDSCSFAGSSSQQM